MSLHDSGIRPAIDAYLTEKAAEKRDYGDYWSASSAGYCMRLNILKRLKIPPVPEITEKALQSQLTFEAGHFLHWWLQNITKEAGLSIAQELELQDEDLMVRGHIDDLVLVDFYSKTHQVTSPNGQQTTIEYGETGSKRSRHLILYDYKTTHSSSFKYKSGTAIGYYHSMQLGTYMYILRKGIYREGGFPTYDGKTFKYKEHDLGRDLTEGRILTIDKNSLVDWEPELRTHEQQLLWSPELEDKVTNYWIALQGYWSEKVLPSCTCLQHDGGFMGRRSKKGRIYNDYFYNDTPCAEEWIKDKLPGGWHV